MGETRHVTRDLCSEGDNSGTVARSALSLSPRPRQAGGVSTSFELVVVGAGRRGLAAGLAAASRLPAEALAVVEQAPRPGGSIATQRSNGFVCELGPFGFTREEVEPLLTRLAAPPPLLPAERTAAYGAIFRSGALERVPVDPLPWSFRTGNEELVQACRRQLGPALRLGRAVVEVVPHGAGWQVVLGGEVPTTLVARQLQLCVPPAAAAGLLAGLDPALAAAGQQLRSEPVAYVFLGGLAAAHGELQGYGILPAADEAAAVVEAIFCTEVFAGRALPGRSLVRCEVVGPAAAGDDPAVVAAAVDDLARWTGSSGQWPFTKVHRAARPAADGALAECRARLQGLAARAPGLQIG